MSEWNNYQLGDILEKIIGGGTPSTSNHEYWNGNISWASVKDIQDKIYKINLTVDSITEAGLKNSASNLISKNTVILATRMSLGRCFIADFDVAINQDLKALIPKKELLDNNYLLWLMASLSKEIDCLGTGTTVKGITLDSLKKIQVKIPNLEEQKRIAAVLSCVDAKIDNLRRQNETLEKIAQTLFKHWFIDFEFPNEEGKPYKSSGGAMSPSELGDIPAGWKVGKLGDEFNIIMGQSPPGESYNEAEDGMIFFQGRTDFDFRFPKVRLYTNKPNRIAEKFDILVSVRAPVGDVNVAFDKCCIGRGLSAVRSDYKSYCLYKIKSYKKNFKVFENEGTVFGSLNKENFNNLNSLIPELKIIESFNSLVLPLDRKILNNTKQIKTLTKTRDTLLPKLMSGEIRIKE